MADFTVTPSKTALLVVDMQNCFVDGYPTSAPDGLDVLERLNYLADVCRENDVQVIFTAHVVRPDGSNIGVMGEVIPPVKGGLITKGNESAAFHNGLIIKDGDIVLDKPRFGAFYGTDLELILKQKGVDTVIIGGIATNVCAETTAREANVRDFRVMFLSDGTSTFGLPDMGMGAVSADDIQRSTCSTLAFFFAEVLTIDAAVGKITAA